MAVCKWCGCDFNLSSVKRRIGQEYGAGTYADYYPEGDVCLDCAIEEISCDVGTGEELMELMGRW